MNIEARLTELGICLPHAPAPAGNYLPARQNGNQLFIQNIEREIAAVERGDCSPLIEEYLTDEERASMQ